MAAQTPVCDFGWKARDFDLPGTDGRRYGLSDVRGAPQRGAGAPLAGMRPCRRAWAVHSGVWS
ncbi:MAG TPA: hypothetical protein VNM24_06185 [Burkholderiales bacterium]|nr:hypothetical protein [Burkholderiales bacterium]